MDRPQLTPQRQKMLMGVAAAGLLLVLGFSFAPKLEVARDDGEAEVDEVLALVEDEASDPRPRLEIEDEPRPFRRSRPMQHVESEVSPKRIEPKLESALAVKPTEETGTSTPLRAVPPAYQQRLELLAEEEAALFRHQRRRGDALPSRGEPVPTVTVASVEAGSESNDVEHALAETRRPGRWRRVELVDGASAASANAGEPRGAWLSGKIEID